MNLKTLINMEIKININVILLKENKKILANQIIQYLILQINLVMKKINQTIC
jgi:hypothetical protein